MLTLGYREADDRIAGLREVRMTGSMAMTNFYVNAQVTNIVLGREWQHLLETLGPSVLLHLLTEVSLFMPIAGTGGNLMQLLGTTLAETPEIEDGSVQHTTAHSRGRKRKRSRPVPKGEDVLEQTRERARMLKRTISCDSAIAPIVRRRTKREATLRKASDVDIVRNRIFYARPIRNRAGRISSGLPIVHIFNRSTPREVLVKQKRKRAGVWAGSAAAGGRVTLKKSTVKARVRRVLMYMWPREHGLHNALTSQTDRWKTREKWPDYTNRDEEIRRKGSARTPKRLQAVSRLVAILLAKHDQLNYAKLLQYCCPSALPVGRLSATEREEILVHLSQAEPGPSMSESQLPCTQSLAVAGCSNPLPAIHDSQSHAKGEGMQKPAFTRYRIASGCVSRFAQSVVRQTFPVELFGSHHNLRVVLKSEWGI